MKDAMKKPMVPSDAELLRLMLAGDEQAFTALYTRYKGVVYRFALLMSGQTSVAEEVTQEVFLALLRKGNRYDPSRGSLKAYLYGAARNQVLLVIKNERPFVQLVEKSAGDEAVPIEQLIAGDDPLGDCARNEANRLLRQAVLALPAIYREVIVLCDFQELSYAEAALALDCPVGTVNSRLHRGHALLLKKLSAAGLDSAAPETQVMRCFA
jgi:RNA polymerase sigma-70 factor (ECF subfamily)